MFERVRAIKKALNQGWVPKYDGVAHGFNEKTGKDEAYKILSDQNHRCVIYYTFKNSSEYCDYIRSKNRLSYGWNSENLSKTDNLIIRMLLDGSYSSRKSK